LTAAEGEWDELNLHCVSSSTLSCTPAIAASWPSLSDRISQSLLLAELLEPIDLLPLPRMIPVEERDWSVVQLKVPEMRKSAGGLLDEVEDSGRAEVPGFETEDGEGGGKVGEEEVS
jgi:hypothetical protein